MIDSSGIGAYLRGCLPYFLETRHNFLLIGDGRRLSEFADRANVDILDCPLKPFSVTETFFPPTRLYKAINKTNLYYSPYFNVPGRIGVPVYTTIHDIIFPDMPELCSRAGLAARMWFYRRAFSLSKTLFTVSRFSKSRIEHYLGDSKPVIVTYSAAPVPVRHDLRLPDEKQRLGTPKEPYILFVGNIKKHKGLSCLLEAFSRIRGARLNYKLIVAGEKNNFRTSERATADKYASNSDGVLFTGLVSGIELEILFRNAALLVQPSLYEGFGLPPLEALLRGVPALISDIEVFKEIYGEYGVTYFRAGSSDSLEEKLLELLGSGMPPRVELSDDLRSKYTFEKTALEIMRNFD
jgi:glycosyltransferase involved in cell wall biosynthesis